jgi:hypothetical protein
MKRLLAIFAGLVLLLGISATAAYAESTGFVFLSPDQSYCRAYDIDSEGNLRGFFRANDTAVKITAGSDGVVSATCNASARGKNLVRHEGVTTFALDNCAIRHEEAGFETTIRVQNGEVTILETGEITMVCHGVPEPRN